VCVCVCVCVHIYIYIYIGSVIVDLELVLADRVSEEDVARSLHDQVAQAPMLKKSSIC
jgi:hypothetical protein